VAELLNYAKSLSCPEAQSLDEEAVEGCLNIDDDGPVAVQMTDSEICDMDVNEKFKGCQ
jgi:hypothetical protein